MGTFTNGLFPGIPTTDTKDSSRKILLLMTMTPGLEKGDYGQPEKEEYKEYRASLVEQLLAVGESQEKADYYADAILKLENDIIQNIEEQDDSGQVKEQKYYTLKKLDEMMPQAKPSELLSAIGVKDSFEMQVLDDKMFLAFAKWFTEDNLGLFKAIEKVVLLNAYSPYLGEDCYWRSGLELPILSSRHIAVQTYLSEELGQLAIEAHYFSAESKEEIKKMTEMMIETFKKRMERLDWLEENTKKEAIKKLDSLTVLIGYPDEWQLSEAETRNGRGRRQACLEKRRSFEVEKWKRNLKELEEAC